MPSKSRREEEEREGFGGKTTSDKKDSKTDRQTEARQNWWQDKGKCMVLKERGNEGCKRLQEKMGPVCI